MENQTTCSHLVEHWILPKADHKPSHKAASTLAPEDTEGKDNNWTAKCKCTRCYPTLHCWLISTHLSTLPLAAMAAIGSSL